MTTIDSIEVTADRPPIFNHSGTETWISFGEVRIKLSKEATDGFLENCRRLAGEDRDDELSDIRRTAYYEGMGVGYDRGVEDGEERGWNTGYDAGHRCGCARKTITIAGGGSYGKGGAA